MENLVSIVVATYRRDSSLDSALKSLSKQTYKNIEIVLVDDNADLQWNDKVSQIVSDFKTNNLAIKIVYLVNEKNLGSAKSRNRAIENAKGEYITFLDDDDVYLPNKIENQLKFMLNNNLDYSVTDLDLYYDNGKLCERKTREFIKSTDSKTLLEYHLMYNITGTDTMMFKKDYLLHIGGFAPIDVGDEFYLIQRAIENCGKFGYLPICDVHAIVHTEDNGLSSGKVKIRGENQLYAHKKKYFNKISRKNRRYIKMRHYAVLAFAQIRAKNVFGFVLNGCISFFVAPIQCIRLVLGRKK